MRGRRLVPLVAAAGVAGCGGSSHTSTSVAATVPVARVQADLLALTHRRGLAARSIWCPGPLPVQAGRVSRCVARYPGGGTGDFRVRQTDAQGDVRLSAAAMIAPEIEHTIAGALGPHRRALIRCPGREPIVVGRTFACRADLGRAVMRFRVRIIDADGGYRVSQI